MVRTWASTEEGADSIPGQETKILQAARHNRKLKHKKLFLNVEPHPHRLIWWVSSGALKSFSQICWVILNTDGL